MHTETKFVASVEAKDQQGNVHTVEMYQNFTFVRTASGTDKLDGLKTLMLSTGEHLNYKGKGKYEDLFGNTYISDDPNAF